MVSLQFHVICVKILVRSLEPGLAVDELLMDGAEDGVPAFKLGSEDLEWLPATPAALALRLLSLEAALVRERCRYIRLWAFSIALLSKPMGHPFRSGRGPVHASPLRNRRGLQQHPPPRAPGPGAVHDRGG